MDTNAILSVALTIISNFAHTVPVAPEAVPRGFDDVVKFTIGRRYFPLDLYLRSKRGDDYWIREGAVTIYNAPKSYFMLQDPRLIPEFVGTARLNSNEVFELANSAVRSSIRVGAPLANIKPLYQAALPYKGQMVPFVRIDWPDPSNPRLLNIARVEVDAGKGVVVSFAQFNEGFYDPARVAQISNLVFAVEAPKVPGPQEANTLPSPGAGGRPP
jgi:hypothetical protein